MRYGKFRIPMHTLNTNFNNALKVLEGIVVIRAEALYHMNCVEYVGISEQFKDLKPGCDAPFYEYDYDPVLNEMIYIEENV
jgi:hypothetical protein